MEVSPRSHLPIYVICHYSQPGRKRELDEELEHFVACIRKETRSPRILIGGDFNRGLKAMREMADKMELWLAQDDLRQMFTHKNAKNEKNSRQLDYIMSNLIHSKAWVDEEAAAKSDHLPLFATLDWNKTPAHLAATEKHPVRLLNKNLEKKDIMKVLMHPDWPKRPFIYLAEKLGMVTTKFRCQFATHKFTKATSNEELGNLELIVT